MTEKKQVHDDTTIVDESKPYDDDQLIMRKLQHEYYMSVRESPDVLRTPSLEDLARLSRKQVIRKKSFDRQKSESRQHATQHELEKRRVRTSDGKAFLHGAHSLPPEVQIAKDEILKQIRTKADRVKLERHAVKSTRLRVVHEELTARKPRVNNRAPLPHLSSSPPEFQALREEIKKYRTTTTAGSQLQAASNHSAVHEELTSRSCQQEAALKYDASESTRGIRKSRRRRSKTGVEAATQGRARTVLIPKTSPLARYKMQWSSRSLCSSSADSCGSSMDGIDDLDMEYLNTPLTSCSTDHHLDIQEVDSKTVTKSEKSSEEVDDAYSLEAGKSPHTASGSSMDLSELALTLSCLMSTVNVDEAFESSGPTTSSTFLTNSARSA
jgi:hypothetical protein